MLSDARTRHEVSARCALGEGDDLADAVGSEEHRHEPVQPEGDASMRGGALPQRRHEVAEGLLPGRRDAQHAVEDELLQRGRVDANGPARDLAPVQHEVVVLRRHRQHLAGVEAGAHLLVGWLLSVRFVFFV